MNSNEENNCDMTRQTGDSLEAVKESALLYEKLQS